MISLVRYLFPIGLMLALSPIVALAEPQRFETPRSDGSVIHWTLDRPEADQAAGILLLAQGSGCQSVERNANLALTRAAFPSFAALMVEKYGVAPGDDPANDHEDCSETFRHHHTITQRVEDVAAVLAELRGNDWWNGALVLIGGSEGGDVIARLSARVDADAAILISTGGSKTFGEMVRQSIMEEMERHAVPENRWPPVDQIFERVRANPQSDEVWAGSSFRFWADAIDHRIMDPMLESETRFLLIQGGRDVSTPPELARLVADAFASKGQANLTYWEFPGLDHAMADAQGIS
ncbi:MAG: alpha/beta hydrolase, partial [Paracoccus sp. (in: a-proteobacteria)]|nr:alpha/beta hydrolase [Paracoccus sp. (in: a-proteobacteria)]